MSGGNLTLSSPLLFMTHIYPPIFPHLSFVTPSFTSLSFSDVPTESQPSTSPFISSLSLSSSEETIGKKLLRKLSEWAICHELMRQHAHTPQMCPNFSGRHSNTDGCFLATGDVSPTLQPTLSCAIDFPDVTVISAGSHMSHLLLFMFWMWVSSCSTVQLEGVLAF